MAQTRTVAIAIAMSNPTSTSTPLRYAPWISDIELAFYSSLASIKINHDKLDSSARKVLGLYEINPKDAEERSTRMQIHGNALTTDEYAFLLSHIDQMILMATTETH